jgi:hypothetical protein
MDKYIENKKREAVGLPLSLLFFCGLYSLQQKKHQERFQVPFIRINLPTDTQKPFSHPNFYHLNLMNPIDIENVDDRVKIPLVSSPL